MNPISSLAGKPTMTVYWMQFLHLVFVNCWSLFQKTFHCWPSSATTVYRMVEELGFFSHTRTFPSVLSAENCNLVFDLTMQEGSHVNCIVLTTPSSSHLVSLDCHPSGSALDYKQYICDCINNLLNGYWLKCWWQFKTDTCKSKMLLNGLGCHLPFDCFSVGKWVGDEPYWI